MTGIADRSLRDMVPVLDRYRPAALAVLAVLVAVAVLPGAVTDSAPAEQAAFDAGAVPDDDLDDEAAVPPPAPADDDDAPTVVPAPAPDTFSQPDRSFSPSDDSFSSPAPSSSDSPSSSGSTSPSPAPFIPTPDSGSDAGADPEPLRIVGSAYASTTAATPVPDDIPDGTLPVGTRVGQVDKASYIRLAGDETTLVLAEVADGRRGSDFETTPVAACRITDSDWESSAEPIAFADAPEHDPEDCVPVMPTADGMWRIDLAGFGDPADPAGFALVPSEEAPIDFQVTFAARAVG